MNAVNYCLYRMKNIKILGRKFGIWQFMYENVCVCDTYWGTVPRILAG